MASRKLSLICAKPVWKARQFLHVTKPSSNQLGIGHSFENIVISRLFLLLE